MIPDRRRARPLRGGRWIAPGRRSRRSRTSRVDGGEGRRRRRRRGRRVNRPGIVAAILITHTATTCKGGVASGPTARIRSDFSAQRRPSRVRRTLERAPPVLAAGRAGLPPWPPNPRSRRVRSVHTMRTIVQRSAMIRRGSLRLWIVPDRGPERDAGASPSALACSAPASGRVGVARMQPLRTSRPLARSDRARA